MHRLTQLFLPSVATLLVAAASLAYAGDPVYVLRGGSQPKVVGGEQTISLPPTQFTGPWSVNVTTVPWYQEWGFGFVTQDDKIRVFHYNSTADELTLDLKTDAGLTGTAMLYDAAAARPVEVDDGQSTWQQYALYVVGFHANGMTVEPYYWVLDQKAIFERWEDDQSTAPYILHHGKLCQPGGPCNAVAGEVQVFSRTAEARHQEIYIQTLELSVNPMEQRIMKVGRNNTPTGGWQVTVGQDLDAGNVDFPNLGFAFDRESEVPYASVAGEVMNLDTGVANCSMGDVVADLTIWSIDPDDYPEFTHSSYTFAAVQLSSSSKIIGYPTGTCPNPSLPSTIEVTVPHEVIKITAQWRHHDGGVVRSLSNNGTVKELSIKVIPGGGTAEDTLQILTQAGTWYGADAVDATLKPTNIGICDQVEDGYCWDNCWLGEDGHVYCLSHEDPPPPRCLDPDDPACATTPVKKGGN